MCVEPHQNTKSFNINYQIIPTLFTTEQILCSCIYFLDIKALLKIKENEWLLLAEFSTWILVYNFVSVTIVYTYNVI